MELIFGLMLMLVSYTLVRGLLQTAKLVDSKYSQKEIDENAYIKIMVTYIGCSIIILFGEGFILMLSILWYLRKV